MARDVEVPMGMPDAYLAASQLDSGGYAEGYADALRDAVEAVKAAYVKDGPAVRSQTEWGVELSVAAIEELRGN